MIDIPNCGQQQYVITICENKILKTIDNFVHLCLSLFSVSEAVHYPISLSLSQDALFHSFCKITDSENQILTI